MLSLSHCAWAWKWKSDRKIKSEKEIKRQSRGRVGAGINTWGDKHLARKEVKQGWRALERKCKHLFASVLVSACIHTKYLCV